SAPPPPPAAAAAAAPAAGTSKSVRPYARGPNVSATRSEPVYVPIVERYGSGGDHHEAHQRMPAGVDKAPSTKEYSCVCVGANDAGEENRAGYFTPPPAGTVLPPPAGTVPTPPAGTVPTPPAGTVPTPPPSPRQWQGEPLIIDLDSQPPPSGSTGPSALLTRAEGRSGCLVGAQRMEEGTPPQQYFAALAAIDAELQQRRGILKCTVAFAPTTHDTRCDLSFPMQHPATDLPCHEEDATMQAPDGEFTPNFREMGTKESAWAAEATKLEEQLGPSQPPAHTTTFGGLVSPLRAVQHTPSSILLNSKHWAPEGVQGQTEEEQEDSATNSDFEMLTPEEQQLLADLRRALSRKR
ncbi:putative glucosamine-6-phosphate isomerase, putative,glucosamine-6-phosphate deaminase, partial [Trypanosoma rangeli]